MRTANIQRKSGHPALRPRWVLGLWALLLGAAPLGAQTMQFSSATSNGAESVASVQLEVVSVNCSGCTVQYDYDDPVSDASYGSDFTMTTGGTLNFSGAPDTQYISITIIPETIYEAGEEIKVYLYSPVGGSIVGQDNHIYTINNDDPAPTVHFSAATSNGPEGDSGTAYDDIELRLTGATQVTANVSYSVNIGSGTASAGVDYNSVSGSKNLLTTAIISLPIIGDTKDEAPETVVLELSSPSHATMGADSVHTYTINDNDPEPAIYFTDPTTYQDENITAGTITVTLSTVSGRDVYFNYSVAGTATGGGTDHDLAAGTDTITAGSLTKDINFTINDDALDEVDETIVVTLQSATNANPSGTTTHTFTIADQDAKPQVFFESATNSQPESLSPIGIVVKLNTLSGKNVSVNYSVGGTSTSPADHNLLAGVSPIPAGDIDDTLWVTIDDELIDEDDETIVVTLLATPTNADLGATTIHTHTIGNNDSPPTIGFAITASNDNEETTPANFAVILDLESGKTVSISYTVAPGTATADSDYILSGGSIDFSPGETSKNITATIVNDSRYEGNEDFTVTLNSSPTNATLDLARQDHTYTINNTDAKPTIGFTGSSSSGAEGAADPIIEISLSDTSEVNASVDYAISVSSTATGGGSDYTFSGSTATINAGQIKTTITPTIVNDVFDENSETLVLTLSNYTDADPGTNTSYTYTITDNDDTPTIQLSATNPTSGSEITTPVNFVIELSAASRLPISVDYTVTGTSTSGIDHNLSSGTASIAPEPNSDTTIVVTINDDSIYEGDETIVLTLSNPANAGPGVPLSQTYTILEEDPEPVIQFGSATSASGEATTPANLQLTLTGSTALDAKVLYSVTGGTATGSGTDYTLASDTAVIAAGLTSTVIPLAVVDDTIDEPDETVTVLIASPIDATLGAPTSHTYTINDNDDPPTVEFAVLAASGDEAVTLAELIVQLSAASANVVTVNYAVDGGGSTATGGGVDYSLTASTLTFNAGETAGTINVTIVDDDVVEPDEIVAVALSNPVDATLGAKDTLSYTILNDDQPPADFTVGLVATTGGADSTDYWNAGNTGLEVTVPVDNNAALTSGTIQLRAKADGGSFENLGTPSTIGGGDLGTDKTLTANATEFEGITGFVEGSVITITAIITDFAGNSTTGTASATTITVDQISPAAFTTGLVETSGGDTVTGYWNASNSGVGVVVPLASDLSLSGGSIKLQAEADGAFEDLGTAVSVTQTDVNNGSKTILVDSVEVSATGVEELTSYSDGDELTFRSILTDVAGNFTTGSVSSSTLTVDETAPTADIIYSDTLANQGDIVTITLNVNEAATASPLIQITYSPSVIPPVPAEMDAGAGPAEWSYDAIMPSSNDGLATVNITATDLAGNALTAENTIGRTRLLVDNTPPGYVLSYSPDSLAKAGDDVTITATVEESVQDAPTPTISIDFAGTGANVSGADMDKAADSIWYYVATIPTGNDGFATVTITALDLAGNTATHISGSTNTLRVDNTPPTITVSSPDSGDYASTTAVSYALGETVASGQVTWTWESGTDDGAPPHVQSLTGAELAAGAHTGVLTDAPTLVQGAAYGLEFIAWDEAGNTDTALVSGVTYDAQPPQAALTYSDTLASEGDTVTITVTFDETATSRPRISIAYAVNTVSATDMDSTSATVWTYDAIIPGGNNGLATVTITGTDLAGNALTTGNTSNRTRLLVDNTPPGYVLSYSDSLVKAGDEVTITATIEESVQPTPTISIDFAGTGADTTGMAMSMAGFDSIWTYVVVTPTGNDGFVTVTIAGTDLAENVMVPISGSTNTLKVDNTPPTITPTSPVDNGFVRTTAVTYALGETVDSGQVTWTLEGGAADGNSPHIKALTGTELIAGTYTGVLTNAPTLVQTAEYTIQFIAWDYAGNPDTAVVSTVTYDTLAPTIGSVVVYDGPAADIDSTSSTDSLTAHWAGFSEPVAGIALYEYALGTTKGDTDVVSWTGNDTTTLVTVKGLQLVHKRRYYFSVRATDGAGNVSDSVSSDGVRIVDRPRLTVSVVQNSVISEYVQIFVNDTLAMADSIRIDIDNMPVSVTEIDTSFAYVGTHKLAGDSSYSLVVIGFSGWENDTSTSSLAMALAKQGQPWIAASVDQRFKTAGSPGSVSGDRYLLVVDSTLMGLSVAEGGAYRLGDGQFAFDQPVHVSMHRGVSRAGQEEAQAIYVLRSNGRWEELPSVDEGELVTTWANSTGTFRLGRRTIIVPQVTSLHQNYPNPFNPTTRIAFDLGFQDGPRQHARVVIYNLLGQEVLILYNGEASTGRYELTWQGVDARGLSAASGVYFVRLSTSTGHQMTRKMLLVR